MGTDEALGTTLSLAEPSRSLVVQERRSSWLEVLRLRNFDWTRMTLPVRAVPASVAALRMVHLSDIHLRYAWEPAYTRLHEELAADPPDLIFLTGDVIDNRRDHRPAMPLVERFLSGLRSRLGIFAILGNHDTYALGEDMRKLGVQMIGGQQRIVEVEEAELELIGLPGLRRHHLPTHFARRFAAPQEDRPRVVLGHFPDHVLLTPELRADIYLAGHTHGGQVCLPSGFAPMRHDTLPRHQCKGAHRINGTWLVVSRGLGFSQARIRMFCPAEAGEIRLVSAHGPV